MKQLLFFTTIFLTTTAFGQITNSKASGITVDTKRTQGPDTALRVIYADKDGLNQTPACFINGRFVMNPNINTQNIVNIDVRNVDTIVNNKLFHGQIYIKTKKGYTPKLISLTELKNKYTNLKSKSVIFMIDNDVVNADYDKYMIDESYLLTIIVDKIQNKKEKINLGLIKILTKTEANIKARNQMILRGADLSMNK
jgi:hypothetical protein